MVELFEQDVRTENRQSSKGNQLKWFAKDIWYKADYAGYEGMAEYMVSMLLQYSNLDKHDFVLYNTEQMRYGYQTYSGCSSRNFQQPGWQLITLERLFQNQFGESLNKCMYSIAEPEERLRFLVEQTERITGLQDFGIYMSKLFTLDAFFLNEDRHTHNMAVLMDGTGNFRYCPVFDNGASLLSDTTMDYPMNVEAERLIGKVKPRAFFRDFDEQLDIAEQLYGQHVKFDFQYEDVMELMEQELYYPEEVKNRVVQIIMEQRRKYRYLFP